MQQEVCEISEIDAKVLDHPAPFRGTVDYHLCPLLDDETDDVLLYLDEAAEVIQARLDARMNVLVHCVQGVSRSVAIVTGYLMKHGSLSFASAYEMVCSKYPNANIADNFRQQLTDYADKYGWNMSQNTIAHRMYRTRNRISKRFGNDAQMAESNSRYMCRKCRQCLFLDSNCIEIEKDNIRVDCMQWMSEQVDACNDGPLTCPRCNVKIGHFNWCGMLNDYENPAFIITGSKVDKMPMSSSFKGDAFPSSRF